MRTVAGPDAQFGANAPCHQGTAREKNEKAGHAREYGGKQSARAIPRSTALPTSFERMAALLTCQNYGATVAFCTIVPRTVAAPCPRNAVDAPQRTRLVSRRTGDCQMDRNPLRPIQCAQHGLDGGTLDVGCPHRRPSGVCRRRS
jgi:hypothetical protein